jgi:Cu(I)/Ag(I) efflux system membrane fusion protein
VTGLDLDSMGGPIPVEVAGRRVFICCIGCESALRKDPDKHLKKLSP